jgi:hypothetical protein
MLWLIERVRCAREHIHKRVLIKKIDVYDVKHSSQSEDRDIFYSIETHRDKHYIADMGMNMIRESHSM